MNFSLILHILQSIKQLIGWEIWWKTQEHTNPSPPQNVWICKHTNGFPFDTNIMYTHLSRLPNTLLICTNSMASIHTKTNTITKHVHICSLRQIYDYLNPASGFIWPAHRSQLTTSRWTAAVESQSSPLLLSHLIHLLADQWDSYWNGPWSSVSSTDALTPCIVH